MQNDAVVKPIDYLVIGNVTKDILPDGYTLGGTAAYSALTAKVMGCKTGVITACEEELDLSILDGIEVIRQPAKGTLTFKNINTPQGRTQYLLDPGEAILNTSIPQKWKETDIVHFGPLCHEIKPEMPEQFSRSLTSITPQGFMRGWEQDGKVFPSAWKEAKRFLGNCQIAVISLEDIQYNERVIDEWVSYVPILVVTKAQNGASIYWDGNVQHFLPVSIEEKDPTGAGDIFAASFFIQYQQCGSPIQAARFANQAAALSVARSGLAGVPSQAEIEKIKKQIGIN